MMNGSDVKMDFDGVMRLLAAELRNTRFVQLDKSVPLRERQKAHADRVYGFCKLTVNRWRKSSDPDEIAATMVWDAVPGAEQYEAVLRALALIPPEETDHA